MGKRFDYCPKCGKKGVYEVRGYDPSPEKGHLFSCRYCNYSKRIPRSNAEDEEDFWYAVVFVEKDTGRRLAVAKPATKVRAIQIAEKWVDSKAERIEVQQNPERKIIWRSDEVQEVKK